MARNQETKEETQAIDMIIRTPNVTPQDCVKIAQATGAIKSDKQS